MKILILGGIREASDLAANLVSEGHDVTTSLAGRTKEPKPVAGNIRIGGFGGPTGLASYLKAEGFDKLIDCTHPFAKQISKNAKQAAEMANVPLEINVRPPWQKAEGDNWTEVKNLEEACEAIPEKARVLLALGSQHIALFAERADVHFVVRMVDRPSDNLPLPDHELVIGKPSADAGTEEALLRENSITHIVCRNSGGKGAYAKIEAARNLDLPVILVQR